MSEVKENINWKALWTIRKYESDAAFEEGKDPFEVVEIPDNLLLNEGIAEMWDIICGLGSPTVYSNANARLGVGDSATAESASQTDLQAASNKLYKAMSATYPQRASQTVTFRAVFTSAEANYAWNEFSVDNGSTPLKNMNRKVSSQGTKAAGQTWTLDLAITLS